MFIYFQFREIVSAQWLKCPILGRTQNTNCDFNWGFLPTVPAPGDTPPSAACTPGRGGREGRGPSASPSYSVFSLVDWLQGVCRQLRLDPRRSGTPESMLALWARQTLRAGSLWSALQGGPFLLWVGVSCSPGRQRWLWSPSKGTNKWCHIASF